MRVVVLVASAILLATPLWANAEGTEAATTPDAVSAAWTPQELQFKLEHSMVQVSMAQYTCKEFRDTVVGLLLALGARKDLQVEPTPCANTQINFGKTPGIYGVPIGIKDGPSVAPQVSIRMQVLRVPVEPPPVSDRIPAHWKSIDLVGRYPEPLGSHECALAKQVVELILPLFSTRNVEYSSTGCDHNNNPTVHLHLEVLVTDQR
jgi:hypothetical protein